MPSNPRISPESGAPTDRNRGSSDIGNVSQVVPALQPNVPITAAGERYEIHTRPFAEATTRPAGIAGMMEGIRALALTGYELFAITAVVLAILATLYPSWRASRINPVESLRHE